MFFFLFSQSMKQNLPENIWLKIELKCQPAGMIPGFFCYKTNRTFILFIRFAEYCLSFRVINKTAYIHQFRFPIIKHMPVTAAYARQQVFNFIYRFYTNVPEMAKLKMDHRITQGLDIDIIVP